MADLKMLHYKQIQYEFCSEEHILFFSPGNNIMQRMTHIDTQFLYMYSIIMARYWDQMKALITTTVCRT